MNYRLTNFEIRKAEGNRISGQEQNEYLFCTAFNPMNRFEKSHNIVIFDNGMVAYYKSKLPLSKGGLLPDEGWSENNMDHQDRIFVNGCTVEYDLGALYCRKYTADIVDANGNVVPGKAAGDFVRDANGNVIVFNKITVFCQYSFKTEAVFDEFGAPIIDPATGNTKVKIIRNAEGSPIEEWVQGWSPYEVGESMRRLLVPYTAAESTATGVSTTEQPSVEEGPNIFGSTQGAQQPATQGVQQPAAQ